MHIDLTDLLDIGNNILFKNCRAEKNSICLAVDFTS